MWERTLSQKIVNKLCEQDVIDTCDAAAYVYGYELLISSVISVLIVVLVSIICGDFVIRFPFCLDLFSNGSILVDTMRHHTYAAILRSLGCF